MIIFSWWYTCFYGFYSNVFFWILDPWSSWLWWQEKRKGWRRTENFIHRGRFSQIWEGVRRYWLMNDRRLGSILVVTGLAFYIYFIFWVIVTPFYPEVASVFPPVRYALLSAGTLGLIFIGTLSVGSCYSWNLWINNI